MLPLMGVSVFGTYQGVCPSPGCQNRPVALGDPNGYGNVSLSAVIGRGEEILNDYFRRRKWNQFSNE